MIMADGESTEASSTPRNQGRGQARDNSALGPSDNIRDARKTWICDQFRCRSESMCQWILFNWKKTQIFYVGLSLKKPAGHVGWNLEKASRPRTILR